MAAKRPGPARRRGKNPKRGRATTPAALVFFAGLALALIALFFAYAFYYLPSQEARQSQPTIQQKSVVKETPQAQPPQTQPAPQPAQTPAAQPPAPPAVQPAAPEAAQPKPGQPRLVIVIDDLGGALDQAKDLLALNIPVTFSILPNLPHTREVDSMAAKAGQEVILHQPMEALGSSPQSPGTLRAGMSVPDTAAILNAHLAQLPHAMGVSNHTGSKATQDPALMAAVMAALKERGLFFLDSLTSAKSVACPQAVKAQVPCLARAVFLDNEKGQQAALLQLAEAEKEARARGQAIAIGHPHPETIAALAAWSIRRDKGVALTTLGRLLKAN